MSLARWIGFPKYVNIAVKEKKVLPTQLVTFFFADISFDKLHHNYNLVFFEKVQKLNENPPFPVFRWQPTRAPSPWEGVLQVRTKSTIFLFEIWITLLCFFLLLKATSPGPVCPQKLPDIRNETEALTQMPKQRLRFLQMIRPQLLRQSEDCLYLNIFIPADAKSSGNPK